jgi:mannobiose 2-epimerase
MVWLMMEARARLGEAPTARLPFLEAVSVAAHEHGLDARDGGLSNSGPPGEPAADRAKVWWAQAEGMVHAARMWRMTSQPRWLGALERIWDFVERELRDREHGGWLAERRPDGTAAGFKTSDWRTPYHDGRALLEVLGLLDL